MPDAYINVIDSGLLGRPYTIQVTTPTATTTSKRTRILHEPWSLRLATSPTSRFFATRTAFLIGNR